MLSSYRLMWILALFDLPVQTKAERKLASKFRNDLLDLGFQMVQFSVYMKYCSSKESAETLIKKVKLAVPKYGNVKIITITDKQFQGILHLGNNEKVPINNDQLALFYFKFSYLQKA